MKDITVTLLDYPDVKVLQAAVYSLKKIKHRIKTVWIIHPPTGFEHLTVLKHYQTIADPHLDPRTMLSSYVLFLKDREYLSPTLDLSTLHLKHDQLVMTHVQRVRHFRIREPFLIKTAAIKEIQIPPFAHLPFKEALLPFWLHSIDEHHMISSEEPCVRTLRKANTKDRVEKARFLQKLDTKNTVQHTPTLSVFIPCFNMDAYVGKAIASCFFQHTHPDQLIVVDDGSEDRSLTEIEKWQDSINIDIIRKGNEGKARALNDALSNVKTDFIMELDADDWLDPDALSIIKQKLQQLPENVSVLYGNFRKWKQRDHGDILYKTITKGRPVQTKQQLLTYHFPLGPRIYRTTALKAVGGFPVVPFANGRLYEDVSVLKQLINDTHFSYQDFTVYNIREHEKSITKQNQDKWHAFKRSL